MSEITTTLRPVPVVPQGKEHQKMLVACSMLMSLGLISTAIQQYNVEHNSVAELLKSVPGTDSTLAQAILGIHQSNLWVSLALAAIGSSLMTAFLVDSLFRIRFVNFGTENAYVRFVDANGIATIETNPEVIRTYVNKTPAAPAAQAYTAPAHTVHP